MNYNHSQLQWQLYQITWLKSVEDCKLEIFNVIGQRRISYIYLIDDVRVSDFNFLYETVIFETFEHNIEYSMGGGGADA